MIKTLQILLLTIVIASCGETQGEFTHTYDSIEGIENAQLIYVPNGADYTDINNSETFRSSLKEASQVISKVNEVAYAIIIADEIGVTSFEDIPAKFINMDARIAVSRNIFQPYFPEEWRAMKGSQFTTLYIQKADDSAVFYLKTVRTGTNQEIGKYSEDY